MNPTSESPNTQGMDDLSSDLNDSADDGDASSAAASQATAAGATTPAVVTGPTRGITLGHDVVKPSGTGND